MGRVQTGYVYEAAGTYYVRYWDTQSLPDSTLKRVQRSEPLCTGPNGKCPSQKQGGIACTVDAKGEKYSIKKVRGKRVLSSDLKLVLTKFMAA